MAEEDCLEDIDLDEINQEEFTRHIFSSLENLTAKELARMYTEASSDAEKNGYLNYVRKQPMLFRLEFFGYFDN